MRTCNFGCIRLSMCSCRCCGCALPWCWNLGAPVAVSHDGEPVGSEHFDPPGADLPSWEVATDKGVHVQSEVSFLQPSDDAPEGVLVEVAEGSFGYSVTGPAAAPAPTEAGSVGVAGLRAFDVLAVWLPPHLPRRLTVVAEILILLASFLHKRRVDAVVLVVPVFGTTRGAAPRDRRVGGASTRLEGCLTSRCRSTATPRLMQPDIDARQRTHPLRA